MIGSQRKNATGLKTKKVSVQTPFFVVMEGIEPPTQGFSVLCSTN